MQKIIVGFYFAEDKLIHHSFNLDTGAFAPRVTKEDADEDGATSIKRAARIVSDYSSSFNVVGVGLAVPSSIANLNPETPDYGWLGTPLGPRKWQNFNAKQLLIQELNALDSALSPPAKIAVISQVGATAMGHFERTLSEEFPDQPSYEKERRNRHHLYVVADYGIGIASYHRSWLFHGCAIPNIGHSMIARHVDDEKIHCSIHPQRDCLNSYASLDAIYRRWPSALSHKGAFEACRDEKILTNVAFYIAQAVGNIALFSSPKKIVMGGRISDNPLFLDHFRANLGVMLETNSTFDDVNYPEIGDMDLLVEHQGDKDDGVRGAVKEAEKLVNSRVTAIGG